MLTIPKRLHPGDTVALVAPASAPPDPKAIDQSIGILETLGFRVRLPRNARKRHGFLAGKDRERADDLMRVFADSKVQAVFCVRGGYGTPRLLPFLDYRVIRQNPKIFVGYSDMTALHCALLLKANLLSFHGPMLASDFIKPDFTPFSRESFLRILMQPEAYGGICRGYTQKTISILRPGTASGELIGGNLSLLCTTLGTPLQPSFQGKILFLEEVGEQPYRFDRMLTHLLNAGVLQQVAGIAIGLCADCEDPRAATAGEYRQTLNDVLAERLLPLKVPVVSGLPFGHVPTNATLPVGGRVRLDADHGDLIITQPVVN
jgi:muramoyltetrapeptide carboxypeptidase